MVNASYTPEGVIPTASAAQLAQGSGADLSQRIVFATRDIPVRRARSARLLRAGFSLRRESGFTQDDAGVMKPLNN